LQRRFVVENIDLESGVDGDEEGSDSESGESNGQPLSKKRKVSGTVGKVKKGQDFWSKADKVLAELFQRLGSSLKSPAWREYVPPLGAPMLPCILIYDRYLSETVVLDQSRYGKGSGNLLPALPFVLPTEQLPLQATNINSNSQQSHLPISSGSRTPVFNEDSSNPLGANIFIA